MFLLVSFPLTKVCFKVIKLKLIVKAQKTYVYAFVKKTWTLQNCNFISKCYLFPCIPNCLKLRVPYPILSHTATFTRRGRILFANSAANLHIIESNGKLLKHAPYNVDIPHIRLFQICLDVLLWTRLQSSSVYLSTEHLCCQEYS